MRLFDRTTRRVRLTAVGKYFLPDARRLVRELELSLTGLKEMARHGTGQVVLACIPTVATSLLPDVIKEYSARFPNNHIRILDDNSNETLQAVVRGKAEFGITTVGANIPEMEFEHLFEDPYVLACRRDHVLAQRRKIRWADLERHNLITVGRLSGNRSQLDFVPSMITIHPLWAYEVQRSFWTGLKMVEAGLGIIAVPKLALPASKDAVLVGLPLTDPSLSRTICMVMRRRTTLSPAAIEFTGLLRKRWKTKT